MKPYTAKPRDKMSNTESVRYSWNFMRDSISKAKKDSRRKRRRKDKQNLVDRIERRFERQPDDWRDW